MATQIGEAVIKLTFDGKEVKASLNRVSSDIENNGKSAGAKWGNAWTVAAGNLISKGISKVLSLINNQIDDAIYRADTLERFPKVMEMMGYNAEDAATSIEKLRESVEEIPTSLADVVSGTQRIAALTGDVGKATKWTMAISDAMLVTTGDVNEASRGMHQFIQILSRGKPLGEDWNTIMEVASPIMNKLAESLGYVGAEIGSEFYTDLQKGKLSIEDMMAALVKLDQEGGAGIEALSEQVKTATGGIETTITIMKQSVSNAIVAMIQDIGADKIKEIINKIKEALVGLVQTIGNIIVFLSENKWVLDMILAFFTGLLAMGIATKVASFFTMLSAFATTNPVLLAIGAISAVLFLLITHIEDVVNFFQSAFTEVANFLGGVCETISGFFSGLWEGFMNGVQGAWDFITSIFSNLASFFGSIFSGAWEAVKNVFSTGGRIFMGIVDGITNAFRQIVNAIITGINHVVAIPFNAINGFLSFLKSIDILGIKPFDWVGTIDVPQIPLLAQGGVVSGATTAVIGEKGREAVLPLENNTGNWAGLLAHTLAEEMQEQGNNGTINVYMTNEINNQLDAQEIGRIMMQSIRRAA